MLRNIAIITTLRCDLKCEHCLRGFPKQRPDFPVELLDKLLTEAMPFGVKHVGLTSGEPHLHPEFDEMVEKIAAYGYTWHFVSHGQRAEPYLPLMERYKDKVTHPTSPKSKGFGGVSEKTEGSIYRRKIHVRRLQLRIAQELRFDLHADPIQRGRLGINAHQAGEQ